MRLLHRIVFLTLACVGLLPVTARSAEKSWAVTVEAGPADRPAQPVTAWLDLPDGFAPAGARLTDASGRDVPVQLTRAGLLRPAGARGVEVHWLAPAMKAGTAATLVLRLTDQASPASGGSAWHDTPGVSAELRHDGRPVLRYEYRPLDESSKDAREATYKVYHHVFDTDGRLVTKGPGGLYTHHRGLFYGFNKVTYGQNKKADVWHCTGDAYQSHEGFLASDAGPVLGRHRVKVAWHGVGKEVFAEEERELTAFALAGGQLVEFVSRVTAKADPVRLDGDPQHAGFHFRAAQEVADKTKGQTYYLRPDGPGKPGETRNWDPKTRQGPVNLPWNAMSFVLGGQRYTALYLDRPANPKEARYSERDYGRFGSYFEATLTPDKPLTVAYRLWLQKGEMTVAEAEAMSRACVEPPAVKLTPRGD
jgi:hypothetical protein